METQNKQWVCLPALDHSGQLGPEDLSSNSKTPSNRLNFNSKQQNIPSKNHQNVSTVENKNGLDQFFVQQVEDAICENSRQTIIRILDEVSRLSSIEKLLLYLKLPTDVTNISDPLRQPLNPLGSRTEISQTIMWIRTHLEEDPELSLPKQEVYNEYTVHCANNKMKPLSTADFGKVMKQVYPSVRPRRLGTRGKSRYCYAGLRKRFKLEVPQLPDLGDRPQSTEAICTPNELTAAACTIICEWAESTLNNRFPSIHVLASYLLRHASQYINVNSRAANMFAEYSETIQSKETVSQELLPYSNHVNVKHKEAQLHLQRKLQQREFKRKLQLQSPKSETKSKCKKSKLQNSRTVSLESVESESPKSQGYQVNIVCDKLTNECTNVTTLPDFSSFQVKQPIPDDGDKVTIKKDIEQLKSSSTQVSRSNSIENEAHDVPDELVPEIKPNFVGKLPIPRLPSHSKMKQAVQSPKGVQSPKKRNQKYKAIQPKPTKGDLPQGELDAADVIQVAPADYLTRERLISVSQVDKDALDDYLHGGSNSQEQEEELMQYFKNNNNSTNHQGFEATQNIANSHLEPDELSNGSKSDKLSQLRLLLEQNLNTNTGIGGAEPVNVTKSAFKKTTLPSTASVPNLSQNLQSKRRVSFETSVIENETVPPSPNTRRKNFSFMPISPGPLSPGAPGAGRQSKCSSTNASPFVSPRNTPVPRRKHLNAKSLKPVLKHEPEMYTEPDKLFGDFMEEKHFVNPTDIMPKCNLPMSAPPSPMLPYKHKLNNSNLLQKLLDSNSKVSYIPDYDKNVQTPMNPSILQPDSLSQEVSQLLSENAQNFNPIENYRSQSVPLHQMTSFKTLMSPCMPNSQQTHFNFNFTSANNSVAPTPVPAEFSDFDTLTDINTGLNNENLNQILNILETTQTSQTETSQTENVFNFDASATNILNQESIVPQNEMISVQKLMRSQSMNLDLDMRELCNPSKSVPNTPLPFSKPKMNLNNNQTELSGNVFCQPITDDFLLNGQPVKEKLLNDAEIAQNSQAFPPSLGFTIDNKINNFRSSADNYGARRNLNSLMEQQYSETDEFTATVPRINSGTP